jgi:hypothetical protein
MTLEKMVDFLLNEIFPKFTTYRIQLSAILIGIVLNCTLSTTVPTKLNEFFTINAENQLSKNRFIADLAKDDNEIDAMMHLQSIDIIDNVIIRNQNLAQRNYNFFFYVFLFATGLIFWGVWAMGNTHLKNKVQLKKDKNLRGYPQY